MKPYLILLMIALLATLLVACHKKEASPFAVVRPLQEATELLPLNEIAPRGWLAEQISDNLAGFTGNLDRLVPDLIIDDDIYGRDRLTRDVKSKDVGNVAEVADWNVQYLWWNSETQSNWRDGYVRSAFLVNDRQHLEKVREHVSYILSTQDEDGYLGIYAPDLRYNFTGENGELWAKASLFRELLAYYEFTGDTRVLEAVERGVQNVMDNFRINESTPYYYPNSNGGNAHGLTFTDVLDRLFQLTGKQEYRDYALFLYKEYSSHEVSETDIQYPSIIDPEYRLKGHGVHTYEHLRALTIAAFATGNPALERALGIYLQRIERATTPSGGPVGDEWVGGRAADATTTGYEYCSLQELLHSYAMLTQKTGRMEYADKAEHLFFNAAQGARHPEKSAIAYLKTDNSYQMAGNKNGHEEPGSKVKQTRYKYSPVHKEAAVCCVPNAGRIAPYYVHNMWLRADDGLIASLLGPCEVTTTVKETRVRISEETDYPYDTRIRFTTEVEQPAEFALKIRIPGWAGRVKVSTDHSRVDDMIVIERRWSGTEEFEVEFEAVPRAEQFNDEYYFACGPLVLARPIEAEETPAVVYAVGFRDYEYRSKGEPVIYRYDGNGQPVKEEGLRFRMSLINPETGAPEEVVLVPMGGTILRQVTFGK